MNHFYTLIEIQETSNGTKSVVPPTIYTDDMVALSALYTVLSAAAVSAIPYHAGLLLRSDGIVIDGKVFDRRVVAE